MRIVPAVTDPNHSANTEVDRDAFLEAWNGLKDTHDFSGLLHEFKVTRPLAMRLAEGRFTRRVANRSVRTLLNNLSNEAIPAMIFIGNKSTKVL